MSGVTNPRASVVAAASLGLFVMAAAPLAFDDYELLQATIYVVSGILAISLAFMWGFGGILSFGHAMFFGLGSYAYAITAIGTGSTSVAIGAAVIVPVAFATLLGYFMFYGRISDVYLGAITLTVDLVLFKLANSSSGPEYKIGSVSLGGFNGIPDVPRIAVPGFPDWELTSTQLFCMAVAVLAFIYVALRILIASDLGRIIISVKENEKRAELLGYDVRLYKLVTFMIAAAIAGVAGCLYAAWASYTDPSTFSLSQSVQVIIWVVVGGVGTLAGPVLGCFLVQWLTTFLTGIDIVNKDIVLGLTLTVIVLLLPQGLLPTLKSLGSLPALTRITRTFAKEGKHHGAR